MNTGNNVKHWACHCVADASPFELRSSPTALPPARQAQQRVLRYARVLTAARQHRRQVRAKDERNAACDEDRDHGRLQHRA